MMDNIQEECRRLDNVGGFALQSGKVSLLSPQT